MDNLADDATVEGSLLDGAVQRAEAVRSIVLTIRSLYDRQEHRFAGPYGANGFLEDYVAQVRGEPIGWCRPSHPQRRREDPARRGELPATQLAAAHCRACCARSSPAPHMPSNSPASPETDFATASCWRADLLAPAPQVAACSCRSPCCQVPLWHEPWPGRFAPGCV